MFDDETDQVGHPAEDMLVAEAGSAWTGAALPSAPIEIREDSLVVAKNQLAGAIEDLVDVLRAPDVLGSIGQVDRSNLAKYLTITKLRLENAIALVRSGESD